MPESSPAVLIRSDPVFGLYAHTTPAQTAAIRDYFYEECDINNPAAKRLRNDDALDLVVFRETDLEDLLGDLGELDNNTAFTPASAPAIPEGFPYAPPVLQILSLGDSDYYAGEMPPDYYKQRDITAADIPALTRMYHDPELIYMEQHGAYSPACFARTHALRALFELRAPETARLMLDDLRASVLTRQDQDDEFSTDENIEDDMAMLSKLGDDACAATIAELHAHGSKNLDYGIRLTEILRNLVEEHPGLRDTCRDAICKELENHPFNDPDYNGFLVSALIDYKAVEAAPVIEQAYAAGNTAIQICGDWEDVQISLGLKTGRDTPEFVRTNAIRAERGQPLLPEPTPHRNLAPKVGRNDPCPCGSGKKYKKCCMQ